MDSSCIVYVIIGIFFIIYEELQNHTYSNIFREDLCKIKDYKQAIQEAPLLFTKPDYMLPKKKQSFIISFLTTTQSYLFMIFALIFVFMIANINANIISQQGNFFILLKNLLLAFGFSFLVCPPIGLIISLLFCRRDVKYASILCRAPFTQEEMHKIGATTEVEYCLVMACYLFVLHCSSVSEMRFCELHNKHAEPCNNPFIHTDCKSYHEALQNFDRDSIISPSVRNWCRFIMHKHGVLHAYRKSRNLGAAITTTLNEDGFVIEDDLMYSLLFPNEDQLFLPEEKLN